MKLAWTYFFIDTSITWWARDHSLPMSEYKTVYVCSLLCNCKSATSKILTHNLHFDLGVKVSIAQVFYLFSFTVIFFFVPILIFNGYLGKVNFILTKFSR